MKVVRCPSCRGASRVAAEAIGHHVACPRCDETFTAIEEATPFSPTSPPPPPRPQLRPRRPPEPESDRPRRRTAEPVGPASDPHGVHQHPHHPEAGKLPASVLVGLALLPFVVPLLWVIGPMLLGQPPMLSLATPIALAVAASALCLAVVYTIDWSPMTRVKGVLMIVGLSYFTGMSLYFLKKEMVDKARSFVGPDRNWAMFEPPGREYRVKMPANTSSDLSHPLKDFELQSYRSSHNTFTGRVSFTVGMAVDNKLAAVSDEDDWFKEVLQSLKNGWGGDPREIKSLQRLMDRYPGRQYEFRNPQSIRVVRIYRSKGKLFYLAVEGQFVDPDDNLVQSFFESFIVLKE